MKVSKTKYYFSPARWKSYGVYLLRRLLVNLDGNAYTPEVHEVEQLMYRYLSCDDCMLAGECQHSDCKCKMPARAHTYKDLCPNKPPKWGPMLSKEAWKSEKEREGINFLLNKTKK